MDDHKPPPVRAADLQQRARIEAVFLTCFDTQAFYLASVLNCFGIRLHRADTLEKLDFLLTVTGSTVVLTDPLVVDGDWRDALRFLARVHPAVGCIVTADPLDYPYISDLYERGACGVLWKPLDCVKASRLVRVVDQAACDRMLLSEERAASSRPAPGVVSFR